MYKDRIELTSQDILEKEFKLDTRGYRPQEVDRFLDMIIKDYDEMTSIIRELDADKKELLEENMLLKKEIRSLRTKLDVIEENDSGVSGATADILRRLSNLEKVVHGKE